VHKILLHIYRNGQMCIKCYCTHKTKKTTLKKQAYLLLYETEAWLGCPSAKTGGYWGSSSFVLLCFGHGVVCFCCCSLQLALRGDVGSIRLKCLLMTNKWLSVSVFFLNGDIWKDREWPHQSNISLCVYVHTFCWTHCDSSCLSR
jgi:hypothetical protein